MGNIYKVYYVTSEGRYLHSTTRDKQEAQSRAKALEANGYQSYYEY